jgi:signal transduction histidine kinase
MNSVDATSDRRGKVPAILRFDDRLATALAQPIGTLAARANIWRHVVDLLAQPGALVDVELREAAYRLLRAARPDVSVAIRVDVARSLAAWRLPADLIAFLVGESPAIAGLVMPGVRLTDSAWLALLPTLSPTARSVLRKRFDLSAGVVRALGCFGAHDLLLPAPDVSVGPDEAQLEPEGAAPTAAPRTSGAVHTRNLMARIDAFRRIDPAAAEGLAEHGAVSAPWRSWPRVAAGGFRFETGADGVILWVEDVPRGPLIGITIAAAAAPSEYGVDGQVADAFFQQAPFKRARLTVGGAGPAAGTWRISGVPFFDPVDGRLAGYRGTAGRPRRDEIAPPATASAGLHGSALPPDSLRQLVHELRTPLNAIVGFAEMIERQLLGPAAREYRSHAAEIGRHGRRLLATVEDLDVSARVETQRLTLERRPVNAASLLMRLRREYDGIGGGRGVSLDVAVGEDLPPIDADPSTVERMFARLLAAAVGLAEAGERIGIGLDQAESSTQPHVALWVMRPRLLAGRDENALLDPGFSPEGEWPDAPVLGLGFALRLVRNLALATGGALEITDDAFRLFLPVRADNLVSGNGLR